MTKKLSVRVALFLMAVLAFILCAVTTDTQESKIGNVYADADPVSNITASLPYYGMSSYSYLSACVYQEICGSIEILDIADDYEGQITASLWTTGGGWIAEGKMSGLYFQGSGSDVTLTPGTYLLNLIWTADGSYSSGDISGVEIVIEPCEIENNYTTWEFEGCQYGSTDSWNFMSSPFMPNTDVEGVEDDVQIAWFYNNGEEEVELTDLTPIGTYAVYPKLVGEDAGWYTLNAKYDDFMMGSRDLDADNPVDFTILKKNINVYVAWDNGDYLSTLTMYDDGASEFVNELYYNAGDLPLVATTNEKGISVEIAKWVDYETFGDVGTAIGEQGKYLIRSGWFNLVSGSESKDNFTIVNSNCIVEISKRTIYIMEDVSGYYTGEEVVPYYDIGVMDWNPGEYYDDIVLPELLVNGNSTLATEVGDMGHIILELEDSINYVIDTGMGYYITKEWDYTVMPGYATIEFDQIADVYYRELIDDWSDKVEITVSTTDPNEEVEIDYIQWSTDGGSSWYSGMPIEDDIVDVYYYGVAIRVWTTESTNGKFAITYDDYYFEIQKAPIYLRVVNSSFIYDGEEHVPAIDNYRYYVYEADVWDKQWSFVRPDIPLDDMVEQVVVDGDMVPHIWTSSETNAGTYPLRVVLNPSLDDYYVIIQNDEDFNGLILDENANYYINKADLNHGIIDLQVHEMVDGVQVDRNYIYGETVYLTAPGVSGFFKDDEFTALCESSWYYNTSSIYASDEEWISVDDDENPLGDTPDAGTYYIKYVGKYANYNDVVVTGTLVIDPKELVFTWYASEDDYNNGQGGIITDNKVDLSVATYTYDGTAQAPFYVITGMVNGDFAPAITSSKIKEQGTWAVIDGAVNVGGYFVDILSMDDPNYKFPNGYPTVCALFNIEKATLTVTPDDGFSKVYGSDDPDFITYTISGAFGDDEPVLDGALDRDGGETVGFYSIKLGNLHLTNDEVNANYTIAMCEIPVQFEITKKEITAIFDIVERVYNATAQQPSFNGFDALEDGDIVSIEFLGGNTISVGNYEKLFKLTGKDADNYKLSTNEVDFSILPLAIAYDVKIDGVVATSVGFDGNEHTLTVEVKNAQGTDDVSISITSNSKKTEAGVYTATLALSGEKATNYKFADGQSTVNWYINTGSVDYALFTSAFNNVTVTYDGDEHTVSKVGNIPDGYTYAYYKANKTSMGYSTTDEEFDGEYEVGTYYVEIRFTNDGNHEPVQSIFRDVVIQPRVITIDWDNTIFVYDGTSKLPEITLQNIVVGEEDGVGVVWSNDGAVDVTTGVVAKVTGLTGINASNYELGGQKQATLVINPRPITVTIDNKSAAYGESKSELTASVTKGSVVAGDDAPYTLSTTASSTKGVGEYAINGTAIDDNYNVTFVPGIYEITPREITVQIADKTSVYGNTPVELTATVSAGSIVNGDNVYTLSSIVTKSTDVGEYPITGTKLNNNYDVTFVNGLYIVTAREITVQIADKTSVYGNNIAELTADIISGSIANNDQNVYRINCKVTSESAVGNYAITGVSQNSNYDITFEDGEYIITARTITVKIDNKTSVYGDNVVELTSSITAGSIVNNDQNVWELLCDASAIADVGEYTITGSTIDNNYAITFVEAVYTITPRAVNVVYSDSHKVVTYGSDDEWSDLGDEMVENDYYIEVALVNSDTIMGSLQISMNTQADGLGQNVIPNQELAVGKYYLIVVGNDVNYDFTIDLGNEAYLQVAKRAITVEIADKTSVYGDNVVALTAEITAGELVNDDATPYTLACVATSASDVGNYAITGTAIDDNYAITFVDGTYVVTKRALTVTIDSKSGIYGNAIEALTANITAGELVNDDATPYTIATTATSTSAIGNYDITGTTVNNNYNITFANEENAYTINAKVVSLVWSTNNSWVFDEQSHKPTCTVAEASIVNGDRVIVTVIGEEIVAGSYTAHASALSNANYVLPANGTSCDFTITKPASYDKPIDSKTAASTGVNLTDVFKNIDTTKDDEENPFKLEFNVGENAVISFNKEAVQNIAGNNVVLKFEVVEGDDAKAIDKEAVAVFEISLSDVEFGENGEATITVDFENKAPNGKVAKLFYIDANGKKVDMKATFKDGKMIFTTPHFSTFAVEYVSTFNPIILVIIALVVIAGVVVVLLVLKKKNGGNNQPKKEAQPAK